MTTEEEKDWDKLSVEEKLTELGFGAGLGDTAFAEGALTQDQLERLHGVLDIAGGSIGAAHDTLEKTVGNAEQCAVCKDVSDLWNELLKTEG